MFVKSLKEHDEALQVIAWLKEDVLGIVQGSSQIELSKITNSAQKLGAYAALFNDAAMKAFNQLTQAAQAVDPSTAEWNAAADDNSRAGL